MSNILSTFALAMMQMKLSEMELPREFLEMFDGKDLELYPHQEESIKILEKNRNVIVSVPTASGKSLIAYVAIFREFLRKGKSMYIVPLRALASEKYDDLKKMESLGLKIVMSVGDYDVSPDFIKRYDVIVCTSEKADSLFHHDPSLMYDISLIVSDELHLIGDEGRGSRLETFLSAARYINPDIKILGLSATISNINDIAGWLDAEAVVSEFRPVTLKKGVIFNKKMQFEDEEEIIFKGKDEIIKICEYFISQGGQILLFVNSRKRSEDLAKKISAGIDPSIMGTIGFEVPVTTETDRYQDILARIIPKGVCFHHAGLSSVQRKLVEDLFRSGKIKILTATPTLAAGVNLPARVVIVRDITRFSDGMVGYISNTEVHQMLGRAGRPKYDNVGYGLIFSASENSMDHAWEYINSEPEPLFSSLGREDLIRFNSLALISTGLSRSVPDIIGFHEKTLLGYQTDISIFSSKFEESVEFLLENGFIQENDGNLTVTKFGKIVSDLYIDPVSALILKKYIENGNISDERSLFYICSAPEVIPLTVKTDETNDILFFLQENDIEERSREDVYPRAKTAMVLLEWIKETSIDAIIERFGIGPGDIQAKVSSAEWISYALSRLSSMLLPEKRAYFEMLNIRIKEGIREEVWELIAIPNIGRVRARRLHNAGFKTLQDLSEASEKDISMIAGFSEKLSGDTINHARTILARRHR